MSSGFGSEILQIIFFGVLSILFFRFAARRNYFKTLSSSDPLWIVSIQWYHVLGAFAIYFAFGMLIMPMLLQAARPFLIGEVKRDTQVAIMTWLNFVNSGFVLSLIIGSSLSRFRSIWIRNQPSYGKDLITMIGTLVLAFPIILFCNAFFDLFINKVMGIENLPDQVAVQWLKMTFDFPFYFSLTGLTIVILAPFLEETLFRGYLQTFLRQYLGVRQAIFLTAICFSFFHFSPSQGWNNVPIIASLFPLALFLGYLYEKRGSLFASISMHATFNAISLINIYLFGQFL